MKWEMTASNRWLAEKLQMGSLPELSRKVNGWMRHPDETLLQRLELTTNHKP